MLRMKAAQCSHRVVLRSRSVRHRSRQVAGAFILTIVGCSDPTSTARVVHERDISLASSQAHSDANILIFFRDKVQPEDRAFVASVAGRAAHYEFQGFPALSVRASNAAVSALRQNPKVVAVQTGIRGTRFGEIKGWQMDPVHWGMSVKRVHDQTSLGNSRFGSGIGIAVIDDLVACYGVSDLFPFNGGSGCAKRVDVTGENDTTTVGHPHGTQVASVIGAGVGNGIGIQGVAPRVQLYSIKVHSAIPPNYLPGDCTDYAQGVDYATYSLSTVVSIINISFGLPANNQFQKDSFANHCYGFQIAVSNAVNANRLVVAAAGNIAQGADSVAFPARLPGVLAVGGAQCSSYSGSACAGIYGASYWTGSAAGSQLGLIAAAEHVRAISGGDQEAYYSGTSLSAPIVAGIAAQVQSRYDMTHKGTCTIEHLKNTAYWRSGWTAIHYGSGLVNAYDAWINTPQIA